MSNKNMRTSALPRTDVNFYKYQILSDVVKYLLTKYIYPTPKEYIDGFEIFTKKYYREFMVALGKRWNTYYQKNLQKNVSIKEKFYNMHANPLILMCNFHTAD